MEGQQISESLPSDASYHVLCSGGGFGSIAPPALVLVAFIWWLWSVWILISACFLMLLSSLDVSQSPVPLFPSNPWYLLPSPSLHPPPRVRLLVFKAAGIRRSLLQLCSSWNIDCVACGTLPASLSISNTKTHRVIQLYGFYAHKKHTQWYIHTDMEHLSFLQWSFCIKVCTPAHFTNVFFSSSTPLYGLIHHPCCWILCWVLKLK